MVYHQLKYLSHTNKTGKIGALQSDIKTDFLFCFYCGCFGKGEISIDVDDRIRFGPYVWSQVSFKM